MELDELHRRTVENWVALVDGIGDEQWHGPTPCSEWDVRHLVNHVVGEDLWTPPIAEGRTMDEVGDRFDGDVLGDDPRGVASSAADSAVSAVAGHLPGHDHVHLSFGDVPIDEYVWQISADHLIHAWDLASATGQDRSMDPEAVEAVAGWFTDREELMRQYGVIGPRQDADADDPQAQLLARFGRDPRWHAAASG